MLRLREKSVFLFLIAVVSSYSLGASATTVSEILNILQQRQMCIHDYDFLISRSFFIQSLNEDEVEGMIKKLWNDDTNNPISLTPEQREQKSRLIDLTALSHSRSKFTGALVRTQGIGLTINNYLIYSSADPRDYQLANLIFPSTGENNADLQKIPAPDMKFGQYKVCLPNLTFDIRKINMQLLPSSEQSFISNDLLANSNNSWLTIPSQSTVTIEDSTFKSYRYSCFPFWHEEILRYATVENTAIVKETAEEIELQITVKESPKNLSFLLYCSPTGRVNRYIKKSTNGQTMLIADYLSYAELKPEGIEIPQVGRMWMPASRLDTASPMPEWTRISSILNGTVNSGLTLDDLAFQVSEGTTIKDQRSGRSPTTQIVTTHPVRLGTNLPDDISKLNESDQ